MTPNASSAKTRRKPEKTKPKLPASVVMREGKTTIRQFAGRRFVRFGELRGKVLAWVEIWTAEDGHSITLRFQDRTTLSLEIAPGFTLKPEHYTTRNGEYKPLKKWPEIRSEG
jgi:hypothetical protein